MKQKAEESSEPIIQSIVDGFDGCGMAYQSDDGTRCSCPCHAGLLYPSVVWGRDTADVIAREMGEPTHFAHD